MGSEIPSLKHVPKSQRASNDQPKRAEVILLSVNANLWICLQTFGLMRRQIETKKIRKTRNSGTEQECAGVRALSPFNNTGRRLD